MWICAIDYQKEQDHMATKKAKEEVEVEVTVIEEPKKKPSAEGMGKALGS